MWWDLLRSPAINPLRNRSPNGLIPRLFRLLRKGPTEIWAATRCAVPWWYNTDIGMFKSIRPGRERWGTLQFRAEVSLLVMTYTVGYFLRANGKVLRCNSKLLPEGMQLITLESLDPQEEIDRIGDLDFLHLRSRHYRHAT